MILLGAGGGAGGRGAVVLLGAILLDVAPRLTGVSQEWVCATCDPLLPIDTRRHRPLLIAEDVEREGLGVGREMEPRSKPYVSETDDCPSPTDIKRLLRSSSTCFPFC